MPLTACAEVAGRTKWSLNRFASFCQMVSVLFGFTELFPPLSELFLRLMSEVSAGGSSEGEEQRDNILSE